METSVHMQRFVDAVFLLRSAHLHVEAGGMERVGVGDI